VCNEHVRQGLGLATMARYFGTPVDAMQRNLLGFAE
jgi:hypothetical protein